MKREEIKTYKDACKVIGRKPRTYKDKHLNLYEQLSTIIAALNFISNNNKSYKPDRWLHYYVYASKTQRAFCLCSSYSANAIFTPVGTPFKLKMISDGNYLIANFEELLNEWFWGE